MEAVLLPRLSYGAPVWATHHNVSKMENLAEKMDNLAAIYTLGNFKSTPMAWHNSRSAVNEAAPTFLAVSLKFFTRKLTTKRWNRHLKQILLLQGFLQPNWLARYHPIDWDQLLQLQQAHPEMVYIQYNQPYNQSKAEYLHLNLSEGESIKDTISLVDSLKDSNSLVIYTDSSYDQIKGGVVQRWAWLWTRNTHWH